MEAAISRAPRRAVSPLLLAAGCILVAANLRPALTTVGPLLDDIRAATGMSAAVAGLLTALPLVVFGAISPMAPRLARRLGIERTLYAAMVVLAAGLVLRSAGPVSAILAGTLVAGTAIAAGNVVLPALIQKDFAHRAGLLTALYSTSMAGVAGLASGVSVPLADAGLGWRGSLAAWALPAVLAALLWWYVARRARTLPPDGAAIAAPRLRRSLLAWQVTLFMGLQSLVFHSLNTWLPSMLVDDGMGEAAAGWMLGTVQVASLVSTMAVPILAARRRSQRGLVLISVGVAAVGLAVLGVAGASAAAVSVVLLGLGTGGSFSLALTFIVLRAGDVRITGALSGMAQSVGYLLAASGPLVIGLLHDVTGSWYPAIVVMALALLGAAGVGLGAAQDRRIGDATLEIREDG